MLNGCDISGYQSPYPDLSTKQFVIIKSTEGVYLVNQEYSAQLAHARSYSGMVVGHYHFPAWGDPVAECDAFIDNSDIRPGEFGALDIENSTQTPWPNDPVSWCVAWTKRYIERMYGNIPLAYTSASVRASFNWIPLAQLNTGCWDAEWNPNGPGDVSPWPSVAIWQNNDTDPVEGANSGDSDEFLGDLSQLEAYCYQGPIINPNGEIEVVTQDDINAIATATAQKILTWDVDKEGAYAGTGTTNLGVTLQWLDSNFKSVTDLLQAGKVTLTPDELTALANALATQLNIADATNFANAVISAAKAQWAK